MSRHADPRRRRRERPPPPDESEEQVGAAVRGLLGADHRFRAGLSLGRLVRRWADVVGEDLAAETTPIALEDGHLLVAATTSAWAAQVRFLAPEVARRVSDAVDGPPVADVRVIVDDRPQKRR